MLLKKQNKRLSRHAQSIVQRDKGRGKFRKSKKKAHICQITK